MKRYLILLACVICLATTNVQADTINMSHDLVRLNIATQNLTPNDQSLDARPLFQATLQHVQSHPEVTLVTLDPGAYYFHTPQSPPDPQTNKVGYYLWLQSLVNLTIDLAGSTIYFDESFLHGFYLTYCQHLTLTNFKIDFLNPPHTYVQLESVNSTARTLAYKTWQGWPDPKSLTAPPEAEVKLEAVAFRHGDMVPGTSTMQVTQPIAGNTLSLLQDNTPWSQSATLATLQPGDIIAVTQRGGGQPVRALGGDSITVSQGAIYGGGTMAVLLQMVSNSTIEQIQVLPRAGSLHSTNADGLHFIDSGPNNHIRNCQVVRTLDDALVMDCLVLATVPAAMTRPATQITVNRTGSLRFPNGTAVDFIDPISCRELPGATIVSQDPPDTDFPVSGTVTLTFNQPVQVPTANSSMTFAAAAQRGAGSSIEGNRVEDILFGRGIWIGGAVGVTIQDNIVGGTSDGGIVVYQGRLSYPIPPGYPTPPAHDIIIQRNVVDGSLGPMASGGGTPIALGGIQVDSTNQNNALAPSPVNSNVAIQYNRVLSSGRTGIWVGQLNGGTISHNTIIAWNLYPNLPLYGINPADEAQLQQDFTQPLVVHNSQNVNSSGNVIVPKRSKMPPVLFLLL